MRKVAGSRARVLVEIGGTPGSRGGSYGTRNRGRSLGGSVEWWESDRYRTGDESGRDDGSGKP